MEFSKWVESQNIDIRQDCFPIQYKFTDQQEIAFQRIYQFIQKIKHFNNIVGKQDIIKLYEKEKEKKLLVPIDIIHLVMLEIVQKQFAYISKITDEEKIPLQVGVNAFQCLSESIFNPFNPAIMKLIIRVHYKTLVRFKGIVTAFYTCFYSRGSIPTEYDLIHSLSKVHDEKIFSAFFAFK